VEVVFSDAQRMTAEFNTVLALYYIVLAALILQVVFRS
jgi:hypothetical protein